MKRLGYRGWIMEDLKVEQVIRIYVGTFSCGKLKGFPAQDKEHPLIWPINQDFDGAKEMIDGVMNKDVDALQRMVSEHPTYDLGLEEWIDKCKREQGRDATVKRTVMREWMKKGFIYRIELERNTLDNSLTIARSIYCGHKRIARDPLSRRETKCLLNALSQTYHKRMRKDQT